MLNFAVLTISRFSVLWLTFSLIFSISLAKDQTLISNEGTAPLSQNLINYLQKESVSTSSAHQAIKTFLNSKYVSIGTFKATEKDGSFKTSSKKRIRHLITLSTSENSIDCRVSLERATIGSKCIAPCGCSGSQKWIQFTTLNKLRRKDPDQWKVCRTCLQKIDYSFVSKYGGIRGNLVSFDLDNLLTLRSIIVILAISFFSVFELPKLMSRILVSKHVWKAYPRWSRITRLPFVFLLWGFKLLIQNFFVVYLQYENLLCRALAQIETSIVEKKLPITYI